MDYYDKEFCLEVWGDMACFTRPELKVERVSYDVITPSAARAIFDSIFWKPAIRWQITKIEVLNPIKWTSIRRNEVGAVGNPSSDGIFIEEKRQQKNSLVLSEVRYRLYAKLIFIPPHERENKNRAGGSDENPGKYNAIFERRAGKGQCFNQPYLGTREFSASFRLIENPSQEETQPIASLNKDLGLMLYDMDFSDPNNIIPAFYHATINKGVIVVPPINSKEILK